jgi:hypothetical protein
MRPDFGSLSPYDEQKVGIVLRRDSQEVVQALGQAVGGCAVQRCNDWEGYGLELPVHCHLYLEHDCVVNEIVIVGV